MAVLNLDKYVNSLVGRAQGANRFFMKAAGYFQFYDQELTGLQLKNMIGNQLSVQRIFVEQASATGDFSVVNLPTNKGHIYLSMTSNTAVGGASFYMTSCVAGQDVWIHIAPGSVASGTVALAMSGCSLVHLGEPFTSLTLYNSGASNAAVHLQCINDDEWTVVGSVGAAAMIVPS